MTDYSKLVNSKVDLALKIADSLLVDGTFKLKEGESFDFSTAQANIASEEEITRRILVVKTNQGLEVIRKQFLFKYVPQLDVYDTISVGGEEFKIGPTIYDNQYITIVEVVSGKV